MKRTIVPCASSISLRTALRRSSNSPLYFAPAIIAPRSSETTRLFFRPSGTSPMWMRRASPSTMAVLPTPGSPIRTGLFLVRRERTWITRRISSSRPMTGSILPRRARSVRSRVYRFSAWYLSSGFGSVIRAEPRTSFEAFSSASFLTPAFARRLAVSASDSARASRKCSLETYSSPNSLAISKARSNTLLRSRARRGSADAPETLGRASRSDSIWPARASGLAPSFWRIGTTTPSDCFSSARRRWSPVSSALPRARASRWASWTASWALMVN